MKDEAVRLGKPLGAEKRLRPRSLVGIGGHRELRYKRLDAVATIMS